MATDNEKQVTRREFLRKASKDAVETGARIVPGGRLAQRFVEADKPQSGDFVENPSRRWWERFVMKERSE
ncbi:MAG: hypothetical protein SFU56_02085 [Capsulimonadales bacterium]|nr:hypothetical protein [Capsulimonadales bacterium]